MVEKEISFWKNFISKITHHWNISKMQSKMNLYWLSRLADSGVVSCIYSDRIETAITVIVAIFDSTVVHALFCPMN